jgi:PEGA domain
MLRTRLVAAVSVIGVAGCLLAGCSGSSSLDWFKPAPPPPQVLQFESEPAGASVQTSQGQTCQTPCSLTVPVASQTATFSMNGYVPQTIPISVHEREHSMFSHPPPDLVPNPAVVALQPVPPPARKGKLKPHKVSARPRPAARPGDIAAPEPERTEQDNAFPAPPAPAGISPFPPPPTQR